ncbi:SDR family oxidoreductase [Niastella caeni]|uniref:SDR family oxidoreductase n=1 Tax=Niastella caeni TaxID=2569763 RepID=A0A4S8I0W4_9BACT|nr:SDR family oxidoreductase [Niastella caeni]THU41657.1 SDR family oxidoreductase [Niastella caeni]
MNVVITGASRGLGKAIAHLFAQNGHDLILTSRNEVALYNAMQEIMTVYPGITVKAKAFDLSVKEEAQAFGKWALGLKVTIDVLINNAGLFDPGSVYNEPDGNLEHMMAVNLYSAYHVTRSVINHMIAQKSGHIFNMCSIASLKAYPNGGAYSISKYALAGFSTNLREEMKPHGIKVTAVYPGAAYTDSWEGSGVDPKRIMQANDIAQMIYSASQLSAQACVEEIILRPQLGDL